MRSKKRKGREKTESFYFFSVKKYDYCDHQNMKMHLVLYYSNPNKKPQWGQILYKNAWRSVNFEMSFWCLQFSQEKKENKSTWGILLVKLNFFVHFLGELKITKKHFENSWPLKSMKPIVFSILIVFYAAWHRSVSNSWLCFKTKLSNMLDLEGVWIVFNSILWYYRTWKLGK